jgi:hypothetical protein
MATTQPLARQMEGLEKNHLGYVTRVCGGWVVVAVSAWKPWPRRLSFAARVCSVVVTLSSLVVMHAHTHTHTHTHIHTHTHT